MRGGARCYPVKSNRLDLTPLGKRRYIKSDHFIVFRDMICRIGQVFLSYLFARNSLLCFGGGGGAAKSRRSHSSSCSRHFGISQSRSRDHRTRLLARSLCCLSAVCTRSVGDGGCWLRRLCNNFMLPSFHCIALAAAARSFFMFALHNCTLCIYTIQRATARRLGKLASERRND